MPVRPVLRDWALVGRDRDWAGDIGQTLYFDYAEVARQGIEARPVVTGSVGEHVFQITSPNLKPVLVSVSRVKSSDPSATLLGCCDRASIRPLVQYSGTVSETDSASIGQSQVGPVSV